MREEKEQNLRLKGETGIMRKKVILCSVCILLDMHVRDVSPYLHGNSTLFCILHFLLTMSGKSSLFCTLTFENVVEDPPLVHSRSHIIQAGYKFCSYYISSSPVFKKKLMITRLRFNVSMGSITNCKVLSNPWKKIFMD